MINRLLARGSLRFYRCHPWQTVLILAGIALGVGVVVAVDMANQSARRALAISVDTVSGGSTHRIVGGPDGIPQSLITQLRLQRGIHASAPVILDYVTVNERTLTLLGIDPVSEIALDRYDRLETGAGNFTGLMGSGGLAIPATLADELALEVGDSLGLRYRGKSQSAGIGGLLGNEAADGLVLTDIATAQILLDRGETLDRIDLVLSSAEAAGLEHWLPDGLTLVDSDRRNQSLRDLTRTFHLNLIAMSLLALLVGGLLIYNTLTFSVLQRWKNWGVFRGLGGTRNELTGIILAEAFALGLAGTVLGVILGIALASWLVGLVLRTVDDLYFVLNVSQFTIDAFSILKGACLGIGVSALAALAPALEVGRAAPAAAIRGSKRERAGRWGVPRLFVAGLALLALGSWLAERQQLSLIAGFVALALQVIGFCGLVPALVILITGMTLKCLASVFNPVTRLALTGIRSGLSRTGMAVAALTVAVAATVGMGIMVSSFRGSLETWLGQTLRGDIYVSVSGAGTSRPGEGIPPEFLDTMESVDGVSGLEYSRYVRVESDIGSLSLQAVGSPATSGSGAAPITDTLLMAPVGAGVPDAFGAGEGILISEPLARHQRLSPGDILTVSTPSGPADLEILGIFRDYRSTTGMAMIHLDAYRRLWGDSGISGVAIHVNDDSARREVLEQLRERAAASPLKLDVQSSADIRERSMAVFEQTFTVTRALRLLTIIVAFVGVLGALMLLQLERLRALAILRATGMTGRQVSALVVVQTLFMGMLSGLLALPLGWLMARVLIDVINVRAFGWTLTPHLPAGIFAEALLLAVVAALLAGVYPAFRAGRVEPARVLRDE